MLEDVVRWAAAEAEHAAELFARDGVLEARHAEEFDLGTGDDREDFKRLAEAARDGVAPGGVLWREQTVLVRARLPWVVAWPVADLEAAVLDRLFDAAGEVDPAGRETPSIAVVDRGMVRDLVAEVTARYAVPVPPRLEGCALVLAQIRFTDEDVDTWLFAAPDREGSPWPS
ncbi:hypothetical protein [uncultured Pseudokineococcus sp.]|uniref:hypothetical protein n=1 Tax=uncultured Pseudokineococcus sp. TaxID=1642928 RepID=UPI002635DFA9|nr:hypothetical protein [uncultured Pseudokineococcus sp.]